MDDVSHLARNGADEGLVVVADEQTAGRGRAGRTWQSAPGTALLCALLLRPSIPPSRLSTLPLLAGLAAAEAIEMTISLPCRVKWPNDLWIREQKVGGMLISARSERNMVDFAVLGIGINILRQSGEAVPGATSLEAEAGRIIKRDSLLQALLTRLDARYTEWIIGDERTMLNAWTERAVLINERVSVVDGREHLTGTFIGVAQDGALLLETDGKVRRVVAGDMSRGPVRAGD